MQQTKREVFFHLALYLFTTLCIAQQNLTIGVNIGNREVALYDRIKVPQRNLRSHPTKV